MFAIPTFLENLTDGGFAFGMGMTFYDRMVFFNNKIPFKMLFNDKNYILNGILSLK